MADPSKNWHSIKFCCSILVRLSLFVLLLYREDQVEETIHQVAIIRQSLANTQYATYNIIIANSATTFLHNLNPLDLGNQRMLEVWQARPFDISFYMYHMSNILKYNLTPGRATSTGLSYTPTPRIHVSRHNIPDNCRRRGRRRQCKFFWQV